MNPQPWFVRVPVAYFAIVLGGAGLAANWTWAHMLWGYHMLPALVLYGAAIAIWGLLCGLYVLKWLRAPHLACDEANDPVQCCFIGLVGVSAMLGALGLDVIGGQVMSEQAMQTDLGVVQQVLPVSFTPALAAGCIHRSAIALFLIGALFTAGFAVWRTGLLWRGDRDVRTNTPILYLPVVAGGFVMGMGCAAFGWTGIAEMAFGAGFYSWLGIESVLLHRFYTAPTLAEPLRPVLGIQFAPPAVGAVCYLALNGGQGDIFAMMLIGFAVLQIAIVLRMIGWIAARPFTPSYWAFTFGATSLTTAILRLSANAPDNPLSFFAQPAFILSNILIAGLLVATIIYLVRSGLTKTAKP